MWRAVPQASQGHICHNRFLFFRGTGSLCVSAKFAGTGISQDSDIRSAGMFANCRISPADAIFWALSWNRVGSVVRGLWFCSGTGGNIHCRKDSPCSTWAKASCVRGRLACAFVRLRRPKAPLCETLLPRPPDDARSALPILAPACVSRGKRRARTACPLHAA